ncbi:hypothetical protein CJD36_021940 [Flavipsychrobacter stenotrophus]|uniref:Uncharacterized protein n=1 Tax=Flavipsychrobacter stenotrophus TaxID=2077091 RepID=A0A2S7SQC8_9BACT|nr:hypothetical protein [Flavipsychrobacter stenotrophus]PQJ08928.1 hypothetical protein CJD36_021940 [Flavipsychrobacter stenotrophus]
MLKKLVADAEFVMTTKPPKEWQVEAFLSAILFCCHASVSGASRILVEYDWDFSRICWLMNTYGNVFDFPFFDRCRKNVCSRRSTTREISQFTNNLRLTPTHAKSQLLEICNDLLSIKPRTDEIKIKAILVEELTE